MFFPALIPYILFNIDRERKTPFNIPKAVCEIKVLVFVFFLLMFTFIYKILRIFVLMCEIQFHTLYTLHKYILMKCHSFFSGHLLSRIIFESCTYILQFLASMVRHISSILHKPVPSYVGSNLLKLILDCAFSPQH